MLALLLACAAGKPTDTASDSSVACPAELRIVLPEKAAPGEVVTLGWEGVEAAPTWEVSEGEVVDGRWTLPADLGLHLDALATVVARAQPEGCPALRAEATLPVGVDERERVLVLYNPEVDGSLAVAEAYAELHALPGDALCPVPSTEMVTLPGEDLSAWLDAVLGCREARGPQVHTIVPVYGVPYKVSDRIADISGSGTKVTVSLDALLVFGEAARTARQAVWNPLWREGDSQAGEYEPAIPFGAYRQDSDEYYMVARIDGASAEAALELVERTALAMELAAKGALAGTVYVDGRYGDDPPAGDEFGSYESGEWNMWGTRAVFESDGRYPVVWDGNAEEFGTAPAPTACPDALYYAGWYSYDNYNDVFTWAPGAIAGHLDSCSACDIRAEGSWSGSALQRGITATFGAVNEPYVAGMPEYDQLFLYLLQGASFGEAAYMSTRVGNWMMVFVGDPLYRPYAPAE